MQHQLHMTKNAPDVEAIKLIQFYEGFALEADERGYCVCTSEGKDSRVLGHLMRRAKVKHFYAHSITGIDPPELIYFQRKNFQKYKDNGYLTYDVKPGISMWKLCEKKKMLPMRVVRFCCEFLKEKKSAEQGNAFLSMGVRKSESASRAKNRDELEIVAHGRRGKNIIMPWDNNENRRTFETCYKDAERRVNPIAYWTNADIWEYSKDVKLEQCDLYTQGFDRLGCIGCPMAREKGRKKEFKMWPKFEQAYIRTAERILKNNDKSNFMKSTGIQTGRDYFDWWISDKVQDKTDENQLSLFEGTL